MFVLYGYVVWCLALLHCLLSASPAQSHCICSEPANNKLTWLTSIFPDMILYSLIFPDMKVIEEEPSPFSFCECPSHLLFFLILIVCFHYNNYFLCWITATSIIAHATTFWRHYEAFFICFKPINENSMKTCLINCFFSVVFKSITSDLIAKEREVGQYLSPEVMSLIILNSKYFLYTKLKL